MTWFGPLRHKTSLIWCLKPLSCVDVSCFMNKAMFRDPIRWNKKYVMATLILRETIGRIQTPYEVQCCICYCAWDWQQNSQSGAVVLCTLPPEQPYWEKEPQSPGTCTIRLWSKWRFVCRDIHLTLIRVESRLVLFVSHLVYHVRMCRPTSRHGCCHKS
jgi:hypothetical protein